MGNVGTGLMAICIPWCRPHKRVPRMERRSVLAKLVRRPRLALPENKFWGHGNVIDDIAVAELQLRAESQGEIECVGQWPCARRVWPPALVWASLAGTGKHE